MTCKINSATEVVSRKHLVVGVYTNPGTGALICRAIFGGGGGAQTGKRRR